MSLCKEIKKTYFGETIVSDCQLLKLTNEFGILKYFFDQEWIVDKLRLAPPIYTIALYPANQPYNIYCWIDSQKTKLAYYFNIVDQVNLAQSSFNYRDLIIDVLFYPDFTWKILDEDEVPHDIPPETRSYIENSVSYVLKNHKSILLDMDAKIDSFH